MGELEGLVTCQVHNDRATVIKRCGRGFGYIIMARFARYSFRSPLRMRDGACLLSSSMTSLCHANLDGVPLIGSHDPGPVK